MSLVRLIKREISVLRGREPRIKVQVRCKKAWYGNEYGGFYIHPDQLNNDSVVYSFGIGEDISFDREIIEKHSCHVYAYDPTPRSIQWIAGQTLPDNFHFSPYGIGVNDGLETFYLPKNKAHVSGSLFKTSVTDSDDKITVPFYKLKTLMAINGHDHIDVLKMDIEGAEYDVIEDILQDGLSLKQILIEFHHRFISDGITYTKDALKILNEKNLRVFAVSLSNNEVSFINEISDKT